MRRLLFFMMVSLDGYFEGPNGEIDWHNTDEEFNTFAIDQLSAVDTLIFGRVTYELMAGYWPTPEALATDPVVAEKMNATPKIVISRTMARPEWENTRLIKDNPGDEIARLKQPPGKDLIIFGSSDLAAGLAALGLIDEYRIMVNPVVLGGGKSLLKGTGQRLQLKLASTRKFNSGNVLLVYQPMG
jgi:dihydrofolate reductase